MRLLGSLIFAAVWLFSIGAEAAEPDWRALTQSAYEQLATRPADAALLNRYGYYAYRAGITAEALNALRASVTHDPQFATAWNNLGALHMSLEQYASAADAFERALLAKPGYSKARYNLAVARFRQGQYYRAITALIDLRKDDPYYVSARTNPTKAEQELDEAIRANPYNPFLRTVKLRYEKLKDVDDHSAWDW